MAHIKVYIHFVWSTRNRECFLDSPNLRTKVWQHIKENAAKKEIFIDTINGYQEHCHCLISLSADQTLSKVMQLVKGESSYWINKQRLCNKKFEWQDEYFAVSESMVGKVREYIKNQEDHHTAILIFEGRWRKVGLKPIFVTPSIHELKLVAIDLPQFKSPGNPQISGKVPSTITIQSGFEQYYFTGGQ